ncbi:MAG: AmmeMemoRadiSam system radical SAM enzyme [Syntrophomonadaceae bacterium]|nr:AmmeMemoRadiSam system radical SAM enzyme [Syntrophomonadaceae bacterium]
MPRVEARFYEKMDDNRVRCVLCPHHCLLKEDQRGLCRVRVNQEGRLYSLNYAELASLALDPIEKKPLFHFFPGSLILSTGTFGCNLACAFCQNYALAHEEPVTRRVDVSGLVDAALQCKPQGSVGVAFTYNEPSIWYEYVRDAAVKLKENDLKVVLVTNGYIEKQPLEELLPYIDAMNIDVKAFTDEFYRRNCRGKLDAVKATVETAVGKTHVEITNLVIPGENDAPGEIEGLARWLASLDPDIPLHLSRYHPAYQFQKEATPEKTLEMARDAARQYLNFVYLGNLGGENNNTFCRACGKLLISRNVYHTHITGLERGNCTNCGSKIAYIIS